MQKPTLKYQRFVMYCGSRYQITRQRGVRVLIPEYVLNRSQRQVCPDCADKGFIHLGSYVRMCGLCKITVEVRGVEFTKTASGYEFGTKRRYYDNGCYSPEGIKKAVDAAKEAYKEAKAEGRTIPELCVIVF